MKVSCHIIFSQAGPGTDEHQLEAAKDLHIWEQAELQQDSLSLLSENSPWWIILQTTPVNPSGMMEIWKYLQESSTGVPSQAMQCCI